MDSKKDYVLITISAMSQHPISVQRLVDSLSQDFNVKVNSIVREAADITLTETEKAPVEL